MMKKLEVNSIKMFLNEPTIEFNRPDGGRSIKTISLCDKEELDLVKDVIILRLLPKVYSIKDKVIRREVDDIETFTEKLNKVIAQREYLTEKQIAARAGISKRYLSKLINGNNTNPTIKVVKKLAEALECEVIDLI